MFVRDHNLFNKTNNTGFTRCATSCATNLAIPSREDDEVSPSLTNTPVSRYLIRPQFSIPAGPNTGRPIPSEETMNALNVTVEIRLTLDHYSRS